MTTPPYITDAYRREAPGHIAGHGADSTLLIESSLFYPTGGGQPGDAGWLDWKGGCIAIGNATKAGGAVALHPAPGIALPPPGAEVTQRIDWERRLAHMRVHTALHLLSVVLPLPVTGGAIGDGKGRLDFAMETPPEDKEALAAALNALVERDLEVTQEWITDAELAANPDLVKTMSVSPPVGAGRVRLVRIADAAGQVDLQPCGGTHVARTGEIGPLRIGKIEKKGRLNRRVYLHLES